MNRRELLKAGAAALWCGGAGAATGPEECDVVVIGAGIAGLVAAWRLTRAGQRVIVLEADSRVGGRMTSDVIEGCVVDRGAQFLSSVYRVLLPLIEEVGLGASLAPTSPWGATVKKRAPRRVKAGDPDTLLSSGLLAAPDWRLYGERYFGEDRVLARRSVNDYSDWAGFDDQDARAWSNRHYNPRITQYLVEPSMQGYYFQSLEGMSRALPMAVLSLVYQSPRTLTLRGGIGSLPERLAAGLDVRLRTRATALMAESGAVRCTTDHGEIRARHAIVATTASAARAIHRPADEIERVLLATGYSTTVVVAAGMTRHWRDADALEQVYGLFVPEVERDIVAAVGIESFKNRDRAPEGEVLNIMLSGAAAAKLMNQPDEAIARRALRELAPWFDGIESATRFTRLYRWREAEPLSPVGRSRALRTYRTRPHAGTRIQLAGDYMGMPWTEGAAESAVWAAERVLSVG